MASNPNAILPTPTPKPADDSAVSKSVKWTPAAADDHFEVRLAEGSITPMSKDAYRKLALELKKAGAIDVLHLLLALDWPDAEECAAAVENEMKLAAIAKVTRK